MTYNTQPWQSAPFDIIRALHSFLDPVSSRALSSAEKRTRDAFYAALPGLIRTHFQCEPSTYLFPSEQHLALTISSMPHAFAIREGHASQLQGADTSAYCMTSSDMKLALTMDEANRAFSLWNLETRKLIHKFAGDDGRIADCDLSEDKNWVVTCGDGGVKLFDLQKKKHVKTLAKEELVGADVILFLPANEPGQKRVVAWSNSLQIWDLENEKRLFDCPNKGWFAAIIVSPDGEKLFFSDGSKGVKIQSLLDPKSLHVINEEHFVHALALNAQGTKLYTADRESIQIWDVNTRKLLTTIATSVQVVKLKVSSDETKLITEEFDGSIKIRHLPTGKITDSFPTEGYAFKGITPDGNLLLLMDDQLHIQSINLAPLPSEIISDIARDCLSHNVTTISKFQRLPSFVKKNIGSKTVMPSRFQRGVALQRLYEYCESDLLPNIAGLCRRMKYARSETEVQDHQKALSYRLSLLPEVTTNLVYNRLFSIHVAKGKCQKTDLCGKKYGFLAFYDRGGITATNEERVMALNGIEVEETPSIKPIIRKRKK